MIQDLLLNKTRRLSGGRGSTIDYVANDRSKKCIRLGETKHYSCHCKLKMRCIPGSFVVFGVKIDGYKEMQHVAISSSVAHHKHLLAVDQPVHSGCCLSTKALPVEHTIMTNERLKLVVLPV